MLSSKTIQCCEAKENEKRIRKEHSGCGKYFYNGRYYCSVHYPIFQVQKDLENGDYSFGKQ